MIGSPLDLWPTWHEKNAHNLNDTLKNCYLNDHPLPLPFGDVQSDWGEILFILIRGDIISGFSRRRGMVGRVVCDRTDDADFIRALLFDVIETVFLWVVFHLPSLPSEILEVLAVVDLAVLLGHLNLLM